MARRVITRDQMIEAFAPARNVLDTAIDRARTTTTLDRYARLHPEITRESGLKRLAGQGRWIVLADELVATIGTVDGFGVLTDDGQHNQGQYLFRCPGGIFTVKQEPHDDADPDDGRYVQEMLVELQVQAELAPDIDADAPIVAYLSVTARKAMLKIRHPTLGEIMKVSVDDLIPVPTPASASHDRPRARARSTRRIAAPGQRPSVDGPPAAP